MMPTELSYMHQRIAIWFGNYPIANLLFITGTLSVSLILLFFMDIRYDYHNRKNQQPTKRQFLIQVSLQTLLATCMLCTLCVTISIAQVWHIAKQHGMYQTQLPYHDVMTMIEKSPIEDKLPENFDNLQHSLVIYYKFGCEDCEAVYDDLQKALPTAENVYWVSTRSKQGQVLREVYPVQNVPAILYITDRNTAVTEELADKWGETVTLNTEKLQNILDLYKANN